MELIKQSFLDNAQLLKAKTSKHAIYGLLIAATAIIIATCLVSYTVTGKISLDGMIQAQRTNIAIWVLDLTPFLFAFWGQYISALIAYEAGAMVADQTSELRIHTTALESQVTHEMTHDSLTDLPNRALFLDRTNQALNSVRHEKGCLAILIFDLHQIKDINNSLGHYNGDRIVKQVSTRLLGVIHEPNTVARLGNDEFGILLPKINHTNDALDYAHKIQKAFQTPFGLEDLSLILHARIGIAVAPEHGVDSDTLLQRAQVAMSASKQDNTDIVIYSTDLDKNSTRRLILMNELRQAIENDDGLILNFQPKINIMTNEISVEALMRWQHKKYALISPIDFIPLAERTGLIKPLSSWLINKALQYCSSWNKQGIPLTISLNLSTIDLMDVDLSDKIAGKLAGHLVAPENLTIEITESAIMKDQDRALQVLTRIAKMGVKISIDDFGTGYSSLSYLSKMPAHELKIDKSFVMNMNNNSADAMIVRTTIDLAHNLALKVVAEGVEDEATLNTLIDLGCDVVQGYYISRPLSADALLEWLKTSSWTNKFSKKNLVETSSVE